MPLLRQLRAAGQSPRQIRLAGFGEIRIECEFAHVCGEIEYSKPPEPKEKKPPDGAKDAAAADSKPTQTGEKGKSSENQPKQE